MEIIKQKTKGKEKGDNLPFFLGVTMHSISVRNEDPIIGYLKIAHPSVIDLSLP